jgi:hypothetical protein
MIYQIINSTSLLSSKLEQAKLDQFAHATLLN